MIPERRFSGLPDVILGKSWFLFTTYRLSQKISVTQFRHKVCVISAPTYITDCKFIILRISWESFKTIDSTLFKGRRWTNFGGRILPGKHRRGSVTCSQCLAKCREISSHYYHQHGRPVRAFYLEEWEWWRDTAIGPGWCRSWTSKHFQTLIHPPFAKTYRRALFFRVILLS